MANDSFKVKNSLNIASGGTGSASGDVTVNSNKLEFHNGTSASAVVTAAHTETLTNKSIDADTNTITNIENADIKAGAAIDRSKLASGTAAHVVINDGTGVLSSEATLAVSRGGTGAATAAAGFDAIAPTTTRGDLIARGASSNSRVAIGAANSVLKSDGTDPAWGSIVNANIDASAAIARSKVASGTASHVVINDGSGNLSSEASLAISRGGTGQVTATAAFDALAPTTTAGDVIYHNGTDNVRLGIGSSSQVLTVSGGAPAWATPSSAPDQSYELSNLSLTPSVASNALTIALKTKAGSDPTAGDPVKIGFRSSTATSGVYNQRQATGALSLTISSGSTLGHASNTTHYIYVYALDNAGTIELAASSTIFDEGTLQSTTAEGGAGAADSGAVLYSTTARSNVPIRKIGRLKSTQTTAGTWAAVPTEVSLLPWLESKISFRANNCGTSFTNDSGTQTAIYTSKDWDTHNAYSTSTGLFTSPATRKFRVSAAISISANAAGIRQIAIYKNGSLYSAPMLVVSAGSSHATRLNCTDTLSLAAGDTVEIRPYQNSGTSLAADSSSACNFFSVVEEGP